MELEIYTQFNDELKNIWVDFEQNAKMTPFQSYAWLSLWQKAVGSPLLSIQPQLVHLHNNGQTTAILPLAIRKKFGINILEWLGGINTDYMGPLVHPDFLYDNNAINLWQKINFGLNNFDAILFHKQSNWVVEFLNQIGFSSNCKQNLKAYQSKLPGDWDTFFNGLKKSLRSDSRRQKRRLAEKGKVNFIPVNNSVDMKEIIKSLIPQKSRRYQETGSRDILANKQYQQFYEGLAYLSSDKFKVHCSSLNVGEVKVATHVGIVDGTTFYYLMPAHEGSEWENFSPGRLLLIELIKWSIENGLKFFDFTVGGDAYKKDWINQETDLYEHKSANSLTGLLLINSLKLKNFLKKSNFILNIVRIFRKIVNK